MTTNQNWLEYVSVINSALNDTIFSNSESAVVGADDGFCLWEEITLDLRKRHGTIYLVGNGASASMASHLSADLAKNGKLHTQVFSDLSLITAMANDISFEQVFAEPLRTSADEGDMLVAISSSGKSPNILAAAEVASQLKMSIVTLSSMDIDNPLRKMGDLNVYVSAGTYGLAESCHSAILHHWMDMVSL